MASLPAETPTLDPYTGKPLIWNGKLLYSAGWDEKDDGGDEKKESPAELTDFKPTLRIRKVWDASLGRDSEYLRLALGPASDGARIFAAAHDGRVSAFDADKGKRLWLTKTKLQLSGGPVATR